MKKLWIISGVIAVTLVIALGQFETKVPEDWGFVHCTSTNKNCGRLEWPLNEHNSTWEWCMAIVQI